MERTDPAPPALPVLPTGPTAATVAAAWLARAYEAALSVALRAVLGPPKPLVTSADLLSDPELAQAAIDADDAEDDRPLRARHPAAGRDEPVQVTPDAVVEALLFATDSPLPPARLAELADLPQRRDVRQVIDAINARYRLMNCPYRVENVAGGYQVMTLPHFAEHVGRLRASRAESRLTSSALETLAIVAFRQPVTRSTIEGIRGVACGDVLRTLMERGLVKMVGRAVEIGRPMLYGTTRKFLRVFGLSSLRDLPRGDPRLGPAPMPGSGTEEGQAPELATAHAAAVEALGEEDDLALPGLPLAPADDDEPSPFDAPA